jgi:hypothetical protein
MERSGVFCIPLIMEHRERLRNFLKDKKMTTRLGLPETLDPPNNQTTPCPKDRLDTSVTQLFVCGKCRRHSMIFVGEECPFCTATYLADCHAATAEYDGQLKSTSAARKRRMASICMTAARALPRKVERGSNQRGSEEVRKRCEKAARLLGGSPDAAEEHDDSR